MFVLSWFVVLALVFAVSSWGGRTIAVHHSDGWEVAAALAVGLSVVTPVVILGRETFADGIAQLLIVAAFGSGLYFGYGRGYDSRT